MAVFLKPLVLTAALLSLFVCACQQGEVSEKGSKKPNSIELSAWVHSGQEAERDVIKNQVERFNSRQKKTKIVLNFIPEGSYNSQVQAASLADELPDLLEFDGPYLYNYVWRGKLAELDQLISSKLKKNIIPSILTQGTFNNRLYSVGMFDSGLGLFARRSILQSAGIRIPENTADAWSAEEFADVLSKLAAVDADGQVLDLKLNYSGEWYTYAFSPIIQSAGADLVARSGERKAVNYLDSSAAVQAMKQLQYWIVDKRYVDPNVDDNAFVDKRAAISWAGHWEYQRYSERVGDDLLLLPLPNFGAGSKSAQGSWNWGITANCKHPGHAAEFLEFLLEDEQVLEMTRANGAVPATWSAMAKSKLYSKGSPLNLFAEQLTKGATIARPRTPAYPVITSVFQQAFDDIRNGGDVREALERAAGEIDRDLLDNRGYQTQ